MCRIRPHHNGKGSARTGGPESDSTRVRVHKGASLPDAVFAATSLVHVPTVQSPIHC